MKGRAEFLLEIGCEEIPAGMIAKAASDLKQILETHLASSRLAQKGSVETFGAPRRLIAIARGIILKQDDITQEILGPPKSVAYDAVGQPTRAAQSFAEKQATPLEKLSIVPTPKGDYLAVKKVIAGRFAKDLLAEIIPQAIRELSFPRSMYWTSASDLRFIRPIRWIVAILDGKVVPFTLAGITSSDTSSGHRFLGKSKIKVKDSADLIDRLRRNFVLAQPSERHKKIETEIQAILAKSGTAPSRGRRADRTRHILKRIPNSHPRRFRSLVLEPPRRNPPNRNARPPKIFRRNRQARRPGPALHSHNQSRQRSQRPGPRRPRKSPTRPFLRRPLLLGNGSKEKARRESPAPEASNVRNPPGQLLRQSRTHARPRPLASQHLEPRWRPRSPRR